MKQLETDVVVVAAGLSGLAASVAAAEGGARVITLEKASNTGGAANMGMGPAAAGSPVQKGSMIEVTPGELFRRHMFYTHYQVDARLVRDYYFKSGDTMTYSKVMTCSSTAYYSGGDGGAAWTTAVGASVGVGTIAVDPKVIPYYTKMFIQTTNGSRVYGMGTALDCGGAIKGNIVDLWFPTYGDCRSWGRRNVTVYILDKRAS